MCINMSLNKGKKQRQKENQKTKGQRVKGLKKKKQEIKRSKGQKIKEKSKD